MQPVEKLEEKIKQTIAYLQANGISIPPELLPVDDTVKEGDLAELTESVNANVAKRIEEVSVKTASALIGHKKDTTNPHKVTAQQIGADRFGSADVVKYKLSNHVKDAGNPHAVTAEQAGADKLGSADMVQRRLSSHAQDTSNPHNVTAKQIGAEELGRVDDVLAQLGQHTLDMENPHRVTAAQLGVDNISLQLDEHLQDNNNPHVVTSEQVGSPRLVVGAEPEHLVAFLTPTGEQKDSGKSIWDFAPAEHIHPTPIPMMMSGGVKQMTLTAGDLTATAPLLFNVTRQVVGGPADVSIPMATALVDGYLSAIDWTIFNNKQNALVFPLASILGGTGVANAGTLTNANNTIITGGGTLALGGFTATVPITGTAAMGAGTLTSVTVNDVTVVAHTHAITLAPALLGNGAMQYQTIVTGAAPFAPVYSGFLLNGTTGGKTVFAVTNTKTLTLTAVNDYNLTVPATGTAALLATANVFTAINTFTGTTATDLPTYSAEFLDANDWTSVDWTGDWATGWVHAAGTTTALSQVHAAVIGTKYQITYTVVRSAGSFTIGFGGLTTAAITATGAWGPTATAVTNLVITPLTTFVGSIIISIVSITAESSALMVFKSSEGTNRLEIRTNKLSVNQAMGISALANLTTGTKNTAIGAYSLQKLTTGQDNSAVGAYTLQNVTTAINCMAFGSYALNATTTGGGNVAIGQSALLANTTGGSNMAIGSYALISNLTGANNVAVGVSALRLCTGGTNVAIGTLAGYQITTGANNTFIGTYAGNDAAQLISASNSMALGYNAYTTASNNVVIGNTSVTAVGIGTYSPTAHLHIVGISDTQQLILVGNATQTANIFCTRKSTGAIQISFDDNGGAIFNEAGNATGDFRVETDVYDALFVDASNDSVMIMSNVAGKVGFYAKAAVAQPAGAAQVAPAAYATGAFGLDSDAKMQALYDLVVAMRLALVNLGIIKGAA